MRKLFDHFKRLYFDCSSVNIKKDLKKIRKNIIVSKEKPYNYYLILKKEIKQYFNNNENVLNYHEGELEYMYNIIYKSSSKYSFNYANIVLAVLTGILSSLCSVYITNTSEIDQFILTFSSEMHGQDLFLLNCFRFIVFILLSVFLGVTLVLLSSLLSKMISYSDSLREEEIIDYKLKTIEGILNYNNNVKDANEFNENNDSIINNTVFKNIFLQLDIQLSNLANYYPYDQSAESDELAKKAIDEFYDTMIENGMIDQNILVNRDIEISLMKDKKRNISSNKQSMLITLIPAGLAAVVEIMGFNDCKLLNLTVEFWVVLFSILLFSFIQNKKSSKRTLNLYEKRDKYYDYELNKINEKINALKNQISA